MAADLLTHAISGAGGGALASVVTYPLIILSTRAQTTAEHQHLGTIEAIRTIISKDGISSLYAGLDSALYAMTITNFVYYYFYEGLKAGYSLKTGSLSAGQSMLTGAYSGAATAFVTNPIWVVNTRMMVNDDRSIVNTVKNIVKRDGIKAFFNGIGPALLLVINPVLNYSIYEQLRLTVQRRRKVSSLDIFLLGAVSKIVATTVTYPLITIKSRLQLGGTLQSSSELGASLLQRLAMVWKEASIEDLYRGWTLKVLQSALQSAFLFFFKEQLFALAIMLTGMLRRVRGRARKAI